LTLRQLHKSRSVWSALVFEWSHVPLQRRGTRSIHGLACSSTRENIHRTVLHQPNT
jgi:hypothetical protein